MSDYFLKSGAAGTGSGADWTNAFTTFAAAIAVMVAGDRLFVSNNHSESYNTSQTLVFPGTLASPNIILCVDDSVASPTTLATSATFTTTSASSIMINGCLYCYGVKFSAGSGGVNSDLQMLQAAASGIQVYEQCDFIIGSTAASGQQINIGAGTTWHRKVYWKNCNIKFGAAGSQAVGLGCGSLQWDGGSVLAGTATPTAIFHMTMSSPYTGDLEVSGVDFHNFDAAINLFMVGSAALPINSGGWVRNCKLPTGWSGSLLSAPLNYGGHARFKMHNCDDGDTNYRTWEEDHAGSTKSRADIYRSNGASDGVNSLSLKMEASSDAEYPTVVLESPEIAAWNDTVGSAVTVAVEVVHDSQGGGASGALTDEEAWLEVQYLGTSGVPLGSFISGRKGLLATAADQPSSSETWTTTGLTTPVKQKLSVTFTPQEKGQIRARVHLAKASAIIYVDPKLTVS